MITEKKFLPEIRLYDFGGDLSQRWFIHWKEDGKPIKKYKGINKYPTVTKRRAAAKQLIKEWQEKLNKRIQGFGGTSYNKQYRTIMNFIERKRASWRESTARQIDSRIRIFLEWNQRHEITNKRITTFLDHLYTIGRKQNTVSGYYLNLRNVIGNSVGEHLFEGIQVKKGGGTPARYFSAAQVKFLSKKISQADPDLWLGVRFIFYCFIRPNELRQLKVGDVLLSDAKICIPAEVSKNKKTQYVVIPDVFLEEIYDELMERSPAEYLVGGKGFDPIGKNWLKNRHQKLLRQLHFDTKQYKLYSWKHTGAVMASASGIGLKQLQIQIRHHSLDQLNMYLRQLGVYDLGDFSSKMPKI